MSPEYKLNLFAKWHRLNLITLWPQKAEYALKRSSAAWEWACLLHILIEPATISDVLRNIWMVSMKPSETIAQRNWDRRIGSYVFAACLHYWAEFLGNREHCIRKGEAHKQGCLLVVNALHQKSLLKKLSKNSPSWPASAKGCIRD